MLVAVGLLVLAGTSCGRLTGENVCQEEQRYTANVTEYILRNTTVRNYQWCLNVPPRCSLYTTKVVNDSRIVEREIIDFIDKCCSGYQENKETSRCTPVCPECLNGTCVDGKCSCFPGYKGIHCDTACDDGEWGENCQFLCGCRGGKCHPEDGNCICPSGWTGDECHFPCGDGFYGPNCQYSCTCDLSTCDPITGECKPPLTSTDLPTHNPNLPTNIHITTNGKFEIDQNPLLSTIAATEITETPFPFFQDEDDKAKIGQMPINNYISTSNDGVYAFTTGPVPMTKSKAKVNSKEVTVATDEENYLNDEARRGNPEINKNHLVSSASAATAISAGIIIVAGIIVAANHFKKSKEKEKEGERNKGVSTVAVYTHSIFHTPLPEPPIFENPIFVSPVETNPLNEGRIETRVVCSMNFPAHSTISKDPRDFLYDHPPSTGSYRAASIPEPPEVVCSQSSRLPEPVYDEIPSGVAPTPVSQPPSYKSALYMNTFGKTRF